jgi:hypothetical protein
MCVIDCGDRNFSLVKRPSDRPLRSVGDFGIVFILSKNPTTLFALFSCTSRTIWVGDLGVVSSVGCTSAEAPPGGMAAPLP